MTKNILSNPRNTEHSLAENPLIVPMGVHKAHIKCPHCESVFIENNRCEDCGKPIEFNALGEPLGLKSYYGLKDKYLNSLTGVVKMFHSLESKESIPALQFQRQLMRRLDLLIDAFKNDQIDSNNHKRLFYLELKCIIDELVYYEYLLEEIELKIVNQLLESKPNISQELIYHLHNSKMQKQCEYDLKLQNKLKHHRALHIFLLVTVISTAAAFLLMFF